MSRGKPLAVGPTARLAKGMSWEKLAAMSAEDIKQERTLSLSFPAASQAHAGRPGVSPDADCHVPASGAVRR